MPNNKTRAYYKGEFTKSKKIVDKYRQNPDLLRQQGALGELLSQREAIAHYEKRFTEVQQDILETCPPERLKQEEEEHEAFLAETTKVLSCANDFIGRIKAHREEEITGDSSAGSSGSDISQLIALMSKQLEEQRLQRIADTEMLKLQLEEQRAQRLADKAALEATLKHTQDELKEVLNNSNNLNLSISSGSSRMKHEPISIPQFSGLYTEWKTFQDLFIAIVDKDTSLYKCEKMHYLKKSLVGDAKEVIETLKGCDENYDQAWEKVQERYDNKSAIVNALVKKFISVPSFSNPSAKGVLKTQGLLAGIVESLENLGAGGKGKDPWVVYIAKSKFDNETQALWSRELGQEPPTWEQFNNYPPCKLCTEKHNCLLHEAFHFSTSTTNSSSSAQVPSTVSVPDSQANLLSQFSTLPWTSGNVTNMSSLHCVEEIGGNVTRVLLATAMVRVLDSHNQVHWCRAILDAGSQVNLVTTRLCQRLRLPLQTANFIVEGVGSINQPAKHQVSLTILTNYEENCKSLSLNCLVMRRVAGNQPNWDALSLNPPIPRGLQLADPQWNHSMSVDLLIGGELYWRIIKDDTQLLGPGQPMLKNSVFGWLIVGPCNSQATPAPTSVTSNTASLESIDSALRRFWDVDEIPDKSESQTEQEEAETLYSATTIRDSDGRYVVHLPFKDNVGNLRDNRPSAFRQLHHLLSRLNKNPDLKLQYGEIFEEYLRLGFIEYVPPSDLKEPAYYMPHHCVVREEATSTKVRVVFNASSKSQSGLSLNDVLKVGPVTQPPLKSILWRFRLHQVAMTCDIIKMYLQTMLHENHRNFQRFLWKGPNDHSVRDYRFRTLCFGVAASPHLATRSLNQLAQDEGSQFPLAANAICKSFYVDDCLMSAPSLGEIVETKHQLIELLRRARMKLSKFQSNNPGVVQPKEGATATEDVQISSQVVKTLGMSWNFVTDTFQFKVKHNLQTTTVTKRFILSTLARIFDSIGLIGPIRTVAKIIFQDTWPVKINWDVEVPEELKTSWDKFIMSLPEVENIRIPRWISDISEVTHRELHAFSDASALAYGVVVYVVCEDNFGHRSTRLLTLKSKVVPIKVNKDGARSMTIPKAELSGAQMAAKLMEDVRESLQISDCFYWTDATVVLHQIHSPKEKREIFVKRRVADILKTSSKEQWRHVRTGENPADLISRGATPHQLMESGLWWNGPEWLSKDASFWPPMFSSCESDSKHGVKLPPVVISSNAAECSSKSQSYVPIHEYLLDHFSSFLRVKRMLSRCLQIARVWMAIHRSRRTRSTSKLYQLGPITVSDMRNAESLLIQWEQQQHLSVVLRAARNGALDKDPRAKSFRKLRPFLDEKGVLRVGGRLQSSEASYNSRHPQILPKGQLAHMIARQEHLTSLHAGPQLLLANLRQKYWPIDGRNLVRKIVRNCHTCIRAKPRPEEQLMGSLPRDRVTNVRPFLAIGIDFAGPLLIRRGTRKDTTEKCYVAVFICFSVKAVHLEVVTSLHTDAFLAAFRRFIGRRGMPARVYSDNGTTFVGADRELQRLWKSSEHQRQVGDFAAEHHIEWNFLPPRGSHHAGLVESAVKSFKHHFKRTIGLHVLTYEQLATILVQIEAVLNSRPLVPMSENPEDLNILCPSMFLTGAALTQLPEPNLQHLNMTHLDKWQVCQRLAQDLSKRWKTEYLNTLQQRNRWNTERIDLRVGDMVLLVDELMPSTAWPLGRVVQTFPGNDGRVRVVNVKTIKGIYRRPITKVVYLPMK
ncbi:uncharacterized protein LOC129808457 [Phlebotomus papatasi]|uniref:uncharacterized protein LOC129808457 n=1 Tax=Phlebotomus papatasi TaxID=29031 RepID=UPI0024835829|nr:uncharacterized protein LOC129808457 [Phlebotomus papatasi]